MCNSFVVYFQIFKTFGYKKLKNSELIVKAKKFINLFYNKTIQDDIYTNSTELTF